MKYNEVRKRGPRRWRRKNNGIFMVVLLTVISIILFVELMMIMRGPQQEENTSNEGSVTNLTRVTANPDYQSETEPTEQAQTEAAPTQAPTQAPVSRRGTAQAIPEDIRASMTGKSMPSGATVSFDDLSYLTIPHYDFDYNPAVGHLVVNKAVAEDVLDIFAELYDIKYPIERMELIDKYNADDYTSIDHNNTSAFNYRVSTDGSGRLSKHALGRAIDINPQINPYVNSSGKGSHSNAQEYWSRNYQSWSSDVAKAAYIGPEAQIYKIFINHGWEWGGSWSSYRDYQHFQKMN